MKRSSQSLGRGIGCAAHKPIRFARCNHQGTKKQRFPCDFGGFHFSDAFRAAAFKVERGVLFGIRAGRGIDHRASRFFRLIPNLQQNRMQQPFTRKAGGSGEHPLITAFGKDDPLVLPQSPQSCLVLLEKCGRRFGKCHRSIFARYNSGVFLRCALCVFCSSLLASSSLQTSKEGTIPALARLIREAGFDAAECYRIRDFPIIREEAKFFLNDGFVIFGKPVRGTRLSMLFSGDIEGGDGEVLITPPHRGERRTLARFTESPTLNEHFKSALLLFSDGSGERLLDEIRAKGQKSQEMGLLLASKYSETVGNLAESFELRILLDLENPARAEQGLFFATIGSQRLGVFDVIHDPMAREQITVGQYVTHDKTAVFDIWTSFESQSVRSGRKKRPDPVYAIERFKIDATLETDLNLKVVTRGDLKITVPGVHVFAFEVTDRMRVDEVRLDGELAEVYKRQSERAVALRLAENGVFLVLAPVGFDSTKQHTIEFRHEGRVVLRAGEKVFFVSSRGTWYPHMRGEFATYDLTFRHPRNLDLVSSGDLVDTKVEGEQRITHRRTPLPIRFAGFNLGEYETVKMIRGGYTIEVCGNKRLELSMAPPAPIAPPPSPFPQRRVQNQSSQLPPLPAPDPLSGLRNVANLVVGAFESMTADFGPPPIKTLTVSPIPGSFGQGFPGLVYLSTMSYLRPADLPAGIRERNQQLFYTELLAAHEVAHQWWGNSVTSSGYQDEWLQEALANYTALMYVEKRKGGKQIDLILADYTRHLLAKDAKGGIVDAAGPITLGIRLQNSQTTDSWRVITYEKGTWILHMLRKQMGDAAFQQLLSSIVREYKQKPLSTEQFRQMAVRMLPVKSPDPQLEVFFDNWIYSTGIPTVKLAMKTGAGLRVSGIMTQLGVGNDFEADVPVEVHFAKGPAQTFWVRSGNEPVEFAFQLKQPATRVTIGSGLLQQQ